ncbi:MAG TPA: aminotransferase class I/II-fold pyridoxal phosphate-dependent enzyme, partial [Verrucomicrobiae bacterium]|nr:aminotransferase class I/II-fold pyridoxal phosphate-dependent enzyme [Verrucomicrobiae bacterium]
MSTIISLAESNRMRKATVAENFCVSVAGEAERQEIYRIRHEVYAHELQQHPANEATRLSDSLDTGNTYLVVTIGGKIAGFVSVTPPGLPAYSIDKYFTREALPFPVDGGLYEVRLLTVLKTHRGSDVAALLMYAAFRWVESHGGTHIVAIGRREILDLYFKVGLKAVGKSASCGLVTYDLLYATVAEIRDTIQPRRGTLARLQGKVRWNLNFSFYKPAECFHGGAFFKAVGERLETLERRESIINADVLDAWFPPSSRVLATLQEHLEWLLRTSPPTSCAGLIEAIAEARSVKTMNILPGAGSSDLIFRALRQWLSPESHVLILDPTYGEYAHVLEHVIGCTVDRLPLSPANDYAVDLDRLRNAFNDKYDLVVLVNPNSPTGRHVPRETLETILREVPAATRVWVDETYVEYAGAGESLERFAVQTENVIVCKSMSKVYALSGARVAYLCAGTHQLESLRAITPPWVVSLTAQAAAICALGDAEYYRERYAQTHGLRENLYARLAALGWRMVPGTANFLLGHLPENGLTAKQLVQGCQRQGLFLRNASCMGLNLGERAVRVAVKDAATNRRMVE